MDKSQRVADWFDSGVLNEGINDIDTSGERFLATYDPEPPEPVPPIPSYQFERGTPTHDFFCSPTFLYPYDACP